MYHDLLFPGINYFSDMTPFENSRYLGFGRLPNNMPNNCVDPVPETKRRTFPKRISTSSAAPRTTSAFATSKGLVGSADADK